MLSPADDFLIHQTSQPIRYPDTSDRRFFDRYFFTGHTCSDEVCFMMGMGSYPNLGVVDAFGSVAIDGVQYTTRASRELGDDRMNTANVGPFTVEVLEGLKRLNVQCQSPDQAVNFDLQWNAAVPAFAEPPKLHREMGRVMEEATRLIQTGYWEGEIKCGDHHLILTRESAWGARDRSWGVRSIGLEREPKGILQAKGANKNRTTLWIWSPMQFSDCTVHFSVSEYPDQRRDVDTVRKIKPFGDEEVLSSAEHNLIFDQQTRELQAGSSVSYIDSNGERRTVHLTPLTRGYLRAGTGYGGPDTWRHGKYMGESWVDSTSFDLTDEEVTKIIGPTHVVCKMSRDDGEVGYGIFETQVYGAYPRYGFNE